MDDVVSAEVNAGQDRSGPSEQPGKSDARLGAFHKPAVRSDRDRIKTTETRRHGDPTVQHTSKWFRPRGLKGKSA